VFACIGDGEGKNRDFGGKIAKMEKVRYGSDDGIKLWKPYKYWAFKTC
jgi:hypothetical protein